MKKNNVKVAVALSGGVDSSVCAYLLKKANYDVIGIFMQNWDQYLNNDIKGHIQNNEKHCDASNDFNDAKIIAKKIGIKIYKVDFIREYWKNVFKYLIEEYKKGNTPNPDVLCNKFIKFGAFCKFVKKKFNINTIATGHYAKIIKKNNINYLALSNDLQKDQTYFLCYIVQKQLNNILFPISNYSKKQIREIARRQGFLNWNKKSSSGICFIGERKFKLFLNNYIKYKKGETIDIDTGRNIGMHDGVMFYTIGQNKGLNLSGNKSKYFVCKKDIKKNILYVCNTNNVSKHLLSTLCTVEKFNWISGKPPKNNNVFIRFRHRQKFVRGKFFIRNNDIEMISLKYKETLFVTPGQFAVLYQNNICLGGGIVKKVNTF